MKARSYLQRFDNVELAVRQRGVGGPEKASPSSEETPSRGCLLRVL